MRVSLCDLPMENMSWAQIYDTWKSTNYRKALPLELDDVGNLTNFNASFYCMYFFNRVRHHIISDSIQNGQGQVFFCAVLQKSLKV